MNRVDMYMCMDVIVSCMFICAHIALYVCYDYVQHCACEDTVSVELHYIN